MTIIGNRTTSVYFVGARNGDGNYSFLRSKNWRRINSPVKSTPVSRYPSPSLIPPRRLSESERPFYSLWIDGQRVINFFLFFLFLYFIFLPFFFLYGSREKGRSSLVSPPAIHIRTVYGTR